MVEADLNYWREDPLFNEHHEHWHLVYPFEGRIDEDAHTKKELKLISQGKALPLFRIWNQRHGELFAYMHAQLLARYKAERLSLGLHDLESWPLPTGSYSDPIPEEYDPGKIVVNVDGINIKPGIRKPNTTLSNLTIRKFANRPGANLSNQTLFYKRLSRGIVSQIYPAGLSQLGEHIEPTDRMLSEYFGALHNDGHLLIALHKNKFLNPGCLFWEATAVRDPVFYRWHTHIDNIFSNYQDTLTPYDFSDLPAKIEVNELKIIEDLGQPNSLSTEMRTRTFRSGQTLHGSQKTSVITKKQQTIEYLSHQDFVYQIEVLNKAEAEVIITVRIFMAPEEKIEDRRAWIEMDKFKKTISPGLSTFERHSQSSSVIRHPVWTADMLEGKTEGPDESGQTPGCRCGWPYTMLLPRGTSSGMSYRFIVFLTPGDDVLSDIMDEENSTSYCGLVDLNYPDKRPMGYPFDRPLSPSIPSIKSFVEGSNRPPQLISTLTTITHY